MTSATSYHVRSIASLAGPPVRLSLRPPAHKERVLDGGWWPRSRHPGAELPGLITAITETRGVVTRILLHADAWSPRPRNLRIDGRVVHLTWSRTADPNLIVVACANDHRLSLLVIPPHANMTRAAAALAAAAAPGNTLHPSEVLIKVSIPLPSVAAERLSDSTWETDGGRVPDSSD
jgi:hypothetical protein